MSGMWGKNLKLSIFGESHGDAIGIVIDGLPSGFALDLDEIDKEMQRRAPNGGDYSTPRKESDKAKILSGFFMGKTTGTPLAVMIENNNTKSKDYGDLEYLMRPSHSDYGYFIKSNGHNDYRGGGHSSGRITAPLVFAGSICKQLLAKKNIYVGSHVKSIASIQDDIFDTNISKQKLQELVTMKFPLLNTSVQEAMHNEIMSAKSEGDSVGGVIEACVVGLQAGLGAPFFDSIESKLASLLFSVPAVKGVEFGCGYEMSKMRGSQANDAFFIKNGEIFTKTNNNGGILGGISNGMPIIFNVAIKPTASIFKEQDSVNIKEKKQAKLTIQGRHDPCIVLRALPVIEAVCAIAIWDICEDYK